MKVAILGAGGAGCTVAAYLESIGHEVRLFDLPEFSDAIARIRKNGCIRLSGELTGTYMPRSLTTNIHEAVSGADIAMLTVPAYGHEAFMDACLPHFSENQVVLNWTSYWSSLRLFPRAVKAGRSDLTIAEAAIMPYMANVESPDGTIVVRAVKQQLWVAAMPAEKTTRVLEIVKEIYPQVTAADNVLQTSFNNINVPFHVATWLMNASHWEHTTGDFDFFGYGITPPVGRISDAIDKERLAVASALRVDSFSFPKLMTMIYGKYGSSGNLSHDVLHTLYSHATWRPKVSFVKYAERDVMEDVPFGLTPLSSLGAQLSVPTPTINAVIQTASVAAGMDFRKFGVDVEKLGIKGMTPTEIIDYAAHGNRR
jgi:opine dehydrogenase